MVSLSFLMASGLLPLAVCFSTPGSIRIDRAESRLALSAHARGKLCTARRDFVQTVTIVGAAAIIPTTTMSPSIASASSGDSASIQIPSYIEYLIEKNKVTDPADMLYKGPDPETQLRRIGEAGSRLPEIASLAEEKKWSQVQGIITGPLGTLLQTLNSVASLAGTKEARDGAKVVKADLLDIGTAAGKKDSATCVKLAGKAAGDLEKFVKVAFK